MFETTFMYPEGVVTDKGEVTDVVFDSFQPVTEEQIMKVVRTSSNASYKLDLKPTKIPKTNATGY